MGVRRGGEFYLILLSASVPEYLTTGNHTSREDL